MCGNLLLSALLRKRAKNLHLFTWFEEVDGTGAKWVLKSVECWKAQNIP